MSETIFLLTICIPLGTILLIFGMKYFSAVQQARARMASEEVYRKIAADATAAQADTASRLATIDAALLDVKTRLASVEKILRDVE